MEIPEGRTRILQQDAEALRGYVTWNSGGQAQGSSTVRSPPHSGTNPFRRLSHLVVVPQVLLHVTHSNLKARFMEIRLDRHMTVER